MIVVWALLSVLALGATEDAANAGCPAGYTGAKCESPICSSASAAAFHDGKANYGEQVALFSRTSDQKCNEFFNFHVDDFLGNVYISISSASIQGAFPVLKLTGPDQSIINSCSDAYVSRTEKIQKFCNLQSSHGTGLYTVQMVWDGDCMIKVTSPTTLSIDGGFVSDPKDDNVQAIVAADNQAITRFPKQGVPSQLAFHVQNEQFPVKPTGVHIYRNGVWDQQFDLVTRYGCTYPHITKQKYNCTDLTPYHAAFYGVDDRGGAWQRVYDFSCDAVAPPTPTGPIPTAPPVDECYNGGILTNGSCYCGEYYEGTQCEWNLCMNGGTPNLRTETCVCAVGYNGQHCEHVQCKVSSDETFNSDYRALAFVIRSASSMQAQMDQIIQAAKNITGTFDGVHTNYFQTFVLSVVQNGGVLFTHEYTDAASFISSMQNVVHPPVDTVCSDALLTAIGQVADTASFRKYPNSPIFVFSDGYSNDDFTSQGYTLQQLSSSRAQVFFLLSDSADGGCNIDISSQGYQTLFFTASFTQGLIVKSSLPNLAQTALQIAATLYKPTTLSTNDFLDCRKTTKYKPFFVDDTVNTVYITATGVNLTLSLVQPDMTISNPIVYFYSGNLNIWVIQNPKLGAYMLNMKSGISLQNECSYRVYASSPYSLYYGASSDLLTDLKTKEPILNQESHLVARIDKYYSYDPIDVSAEVTVWTNDQLGNRVNLYSSSGVWRDGCKYDIYFGSFTCQVAFMPFYISVYLTDSNGITVSRTSTGYCAAAPPPPAGEQCQNGGATYNGTCVCASHFSGDKCQTINCENQGTPLFGKCKCPPGFDGQFCQTISCLAYNPYVHVDYNHRSLTFLVHDSITTRSVMRSINDVATRVIHDIVHQHQYWFDNYQLLRFNDTDSTVGSDGPDPQAFLDGISKMVSYNQMHSDYSCNNLDMYATLLTAVQDQNVAFGGIFYVFLFGSARIDLDSYDKILAHVEINKIQINVVQFSMNPCGNDYTKDGLMSLTQATGGSYILSSGPNAGNVMKSVPTNFQSALVYEKSAKNCSDVTFYIPVDDSTQAFTSYIQADLTMDPVYTRPDGSVADFLTVSNVWKDVAMDSRMDQVIRACDSGWTLEDGHCWQFQFKTKSWQDAKAYCSAAGASLATIYNKAEQSYLDQDSIGAKFWIGLNDIVLLNKWVWDAPNNFSIPLTTTHFTNWAAGQPKAGDSNRCVLDDNAVSNGWVTADCSEKHYFACVKNTYNPDFENSKAEPVQRGVWGIRVQADGDCSITVRSQSALQVITSFSTDIHTDVGVSEPISDSTTNRVIAHVTGLDAGITHSLEYAHMYGDDGSLVQAQNMMGRDGCMFNYISTPFHCPSSAFQMMLTGIDSSGFAYQRIVPVMCTGGVSKNSCENGGVYYEGACVCPPNFVGDNCEWIMCQNGGRPTGALDKCLCAPGFTGQFCDMPVCTRIGEVPNISSNGKTFILALDGSSSGDMKDVLNNINSTLTNLMTNTLHSNPGWFTSFVAVVFRDSKSGNVPIFSNTITATDYHLWINQIVNELTSNPYQSTQTARAIFAALDQAISDPSVVDGSIAFVLTTGNAEDVQNEGRVVAATARTHTAINMMFVGDKWAPGGQNYADPTVHDLFQAAHYSGGSAYQVHSASSLSNNWLTLLGTLHNTYYVISHDIGNCSQYTDYLQLGTNQNDIVIDLFALGSPTVTAQNPDGQDAKAISLFTTQTNSLTQFTQTGADVGIWKVAIDSKGKDTGTCMFNARAISPLQVYVGFTQDVESDNGLHDGSAVPYPQAGDQANAVVATTNMAGNNVVLNYAQLFDVEERALLWASPMIVRSTCAYPYITTETFRCDRSSYILAIDGLDSVGHPFRRMFTYHCQGTLIPTNPPVTGPNPPATTSVIPDTTTTSLPLCDPTVPKVDLVLVFDTSAGIDVSDYQQIVSSFNDLAFAMTLDANHSRVMMGAYDSGVSFGATLISDIHDSTGYVRRMSAIQNEYTGLVGNNVDGVLTYLNSTQAISPFRQAARKVVVLVSSTGWDKGNFYNGAEHGFTDPTADATKLKQMGVEFIPIAFGEQANIQQLTALSSKCLQTANSVADFARINNFIANNICSATPVC